ncbi:MAG: DNA mismatch repair endonuclease MutL [Saprospiraceae bacterium]|nr:DNA mismatch repair endonuclease MutL [Saprospiraceae bacterium]
MADIIQLLPDSIANQIAAGEVVQRPASVVKELMENAIDAGASHIKLIIKDAGKQSVQVIDNGAGMSPTDARMSFERHATSKINKAEDLFAIRTLGFRGEALASIAAVAQVDLKTRQHDLDLGTHLVIEGSNVSKQEVCETSPGTNIQVKNLFFNIPARRKFLKSNTVEFRHILDEFQRIAIAHPEVHFEAFHNGTETYHLPPGTLRKRLVNLFGKGFNDKLVPVDEETDLCKISGFVGKPDSAKKTRGEQFFLLNDRFIKSAYLNHAVLLAYENLINPGTYPFYLLAVKMDPERVDINVHPTKQEVKFEDEPLVYNIIKSAVKHALNQYNIAPSLDFEQNPVFSTSTASPRAVTGKILIPSSFSKPPRLDNWEELYKDLEKTSPVIPESTTSQLSNFEGENQGLKEPAQIHQSYIISQIKSGFLVIDQQNAHERILFERYLMQIREKPAGTQKLVFPKTIEFPAHEAMILESMLETIQKLGFEIESFGKNTFILHGIPAHLSNIGEEENLFHELLEQFRMNVDLDWSEEKKLAALLARSSCTKRGTAMNPMEMRSLIDQLFACDEPFKSPFGKKCFITFELEQLESKFNQ